MDALVILAPVAAPARLLRVELALTPAARAAGLAGRAALPPDRGMLFVFPGDVRVPFTTAATLAPLDVAFADAAGRVLRVVHRAAPGDPAPHDPGAAYRYAVELAGGRAAAWGLGPGARLVLPRGLGAWAT